MCELFFNHIFKSPNLQRIHFGFEKNLVAEMKPGYPFTGEIFIFLKKLTKPYNIQPFSF